MAITRVEGPMLLSNLDRQGTNLEFTTTGDSLLFLDFTAFKVGVNTNAPTETLTVDGNALVSNVLIDDTSTISTALTDQHLTLRANGVGNVVVINANVQSGNIDGTQIGTVTPTRAVFTSANTTGKATLNTAKVNNLSAGRVVFTAEDGAQLEDDVNLLYFASNSTLISGNITATGVVNYPSITSGNIYIDPTGHEHHVMYLAPNLMMVGTDSLQFFAGNSLLSTGDLKLTLPTQNRILYKDTSDFVVVSDNLFYDGFTLNSQNITIVNNLRMTSTSITTTGISDDITLSPLGPDGVINFGSHRLTGAVAPVLPTDVATKAYADALLSGADIVASKIGAGGSRDPDTGALTTEFSIEDPAFELPGNIYMVIDSIKQAEFTNGFANIQNFVFHESKISTTIGDMLLEPEGNSRVRINSTSALRIPSGPTGRRPTGEVGDIRLNTDVSTLEWYDGGEWSGLVPAARSQTITPDGVTNSFTLTYTATAETVIVTINGVTQRPAYAYTVDGDQIEFIEVPLVTDIIEVRFLSVNITYASTPYFVNIPYLPFDTSFVTVESWYIAQYRSAQYTFTFKNLAQSQVAMGEVYVIHDGLDAHVAVKEYSAGSSNYLSWQASIDFYGVLTLQVKGANSGNLMKYRATYFAEDPILTITWVTASGTLGTFNDNATPPSRTGIVRTVLATVDGVGSVSYSISTGALPPGLSLSTSGVISGTAAAVVADTTYNFSIYASAPGAADLARSFSITIKAPV